MVAGRVQGGWLTCTHLELQQSSPPVIPTARLSPAFLCKCNAAIKYLGRGDWQGQPPQSHPLHLGAEGQELVQSQGVSTLLVLDSVLGPPAAPRSPTVSIGVHEEALQESRWPKGTPQADVGAHILSPPFTWGNPSNPMPVVVKVGRA